MYIVIWSKSAQKELRRLPRQYVAAIVARVEALQDEPHPAGSKKLQGYQDLYRIRQGSYRVLYQVRNLQLHVVVVEIGHRRDVYRQY